MAFTFYYETHIEQVISNHYKNNKFIEPDDLEIIRIAESLEVDLRFDNCKSCSDTEDRIIILNIREPQIRSRMIFFHELCHVLFHSGDQRRMPPLFKDAQEYEADNFILYAAMPFFMINRLQLPSSKTEMIQTLATTFKVPFNLAEKRLDQIRRREYEGRLLNSQMKFNTTRYIHQKDAPDVLDTAVYAYYDSSWDSTGPSQIIIQVDQQTLLSQDDFEFSLEGPFKRIEEHHLQGFIDCKPVKLQDLDFTRDGRISVRLKNLAVRYYNSAFKFIVQRKDLEQLLHFYGAEF
ncbi:ImmA/IrrE family metallo-endopeptidase [Paenibacillus cisolokensis]|uniref:ImmA/IrrE family metallo-endopeptidase n=1 Tax=Paenibacillus cisolokensis TaxID=1658519 RepID=UPI003D2B287C